MYSASTEVNDVSYFRQKELHYLSTITMLIPLTSRWRAPFLLSRAFNFSCASPNSFLKLIWRTTKTPVTAKSSTIPTTLSERVIVLANQFVDNLNLMFLLTNVTGQNQNPGSRFNFLHWSPNDFGGNLATLSDRADDERGDVGVENTQEERDRGRLECPHASGPA